MAHNGTEDKSAGLMDVTLRKLRRGNPAPDVYEIRPREDRDGFDLISDRLRYGPIWYAGPDAVRCAVAYAKYCSRSCSRPAVIRVCGQAVPYRRRWWEPTASTRWPRGFACSAPLRDIRSKRFSKHPEPPRTPGCTPNAPPSLSPSPEGRSQPLPPPGHKHPGKGKGLRESIAAMMAARVGRS